MALPKDAVPISSLPDDAVPISEMPSDEQYIQETPESSISPQAAMLGLGGTAAVAGGALGIGAYNYLYQPKIRQENKAILGQVADIQKQFGLEGTMLNETPKMLSNKSSEVRRTGQIKIQDWDFETKRNIDTLKSQIDNIDRKLFSTTEDLSKSIKSGYIPNILKEGPRVYGSSLKSISKAMEKSGVKFDNVDFAEGVFDRAIEIAKKQGIPEEEVARLVIARDSILPKASADGIYEATKPMTVSQAQQTVARVMNEKPLSRISSILGESWGDMLDSKAPSGFKDGIQKLKSQYRKFTQIRSSLGNVINLSTGEYDSKALNKYLMDYAKSNVDTGVENVLKILGEGSPMTTAIEGVKGKASELSKLKSARGATKDTISVISQSGKINKQALKDSVMKEIDNILKWKSKAEILLSKSKNLEEKIASRNPAKVLIKSILPKGMGRILGGLAEGPIIDELQKRVIGIDPLRAMEFGIGATKPTESEIADFIKANMT